MKILVMGGTQFVSSYVAKHLISKPKAEMFGCSKPRDPRPGVFSCTGPGGAFIALDCLADRAGLSLRRTDDRVWLWI